MKDPVAFTFRLPQVVRNRAAEAAEEEHVSMNSWLVRLIDAELAKRARRRAAEKGEGQNRVNGLPLGDESPNLVKS